MVNNDCDSPSADGDRGGEQTQDGEGGGPQSDDTAALGSRSSSDPEDSLKQHQASPTAEDVSISMDESAIASTATKTEIKSDMMPRKPENRTVKRKLLCLYCERSFVSANLRQKHVERVHSLKPSRRVSARRLNQLSGTPCGYCDKYNDSEHTLNDLFQHLTREHSSKYFGCLQCEERFTSSVQLVEHTATKHFTETPTLMVILPNASSQIEQLEAGEAEEVEEVTHKVTRSKLKSKLSEESSVKSEEPVLPKQKKKTKLKELREKRITVKSSKIALKRSSRLKQQAKDLQEVQKKRRDKNGKQQLNSNAKPTEKSKPTSINPYPEFDHFYRVKKISDHSIDNLKISSLTFDDVFDKAFFNRIKCNIEENLLHHIDGKLFKNEESESRISNFEKVQTVQETPNSNSENYGCELSLNAATPTTSLALNSQVCEDLESQIEYGSKPSKKKPPVKSDEVHYKYFTRRKYQASILQQKENRDLSKLDMWTQMVVKDRQERLLNKKKSAKEMQEYTCSNEYKNKVRRQELNRVLDRRGPFEDLKEEASKKAAFDKLNSVSAISPEVFGEVREVLNDLLNRVFETIDGDEKVQDKDKPVVTDQREIPEFLELRRKTSATNEEIDQSDKIALICSSQETENFELPSNSIRGKNEQVELTGEWARSRMYICAACGGKFSNMKYLLEHKSAYHQNVWVQHYEFVGNQSELYRHLSIPALGKVGVVEETIPCKQWRRSESRMCTKCAKQCNSLGELHRHMLECGGDWTWMLARRKVKYRPFRAKYRRRRTGFEPKTQPKRKTEPTEKKINQKPVYTPRQRPSDAETIQRMLANLPAKRCRRSVMSLPDASKKAKNSKQNTQSTTSKSKLKCGKAIRVKHVTDVPNQNQKRRNLRSLNRVLSSRILDVNSTLMVKRKIKMLRSQRLTRSSAAVNVQQEEEHSVTEEAAQKKRKGAKKEAEPNEVKIRPKRTVGSRLNLKNFFPVKKKNSNTRQKSVDDYHEDKADFTQQKNKKGGLKGFVRGLSLRKRTSREEESLRQDTKPIEQPDAGKRKLSRCFRNVINKVKKLKIDKKSEAAPEPFLEKREDPSVAPREPEENRPDTEEPPLIAENPTIPEAIFDLADNKEDKSLQAKGELNFDSKTPEMLTPVAVDTTLKPKTVPMVSPNPKGKIRKPNRGLNDCIAMLTSKLQNKDDKVSSSLESLFSTSSTASVEPRAIPKPPTFIFTPAVEETALDLSKKCVSTPDLSDLLVVPKPVTWNSVDDIIQQVVASSLSYSLEKEQQMIGKRTNLDDTIDFVVNGWFEKPKKSKKRRHSDNNLITNILFGKDKLIIAPSGNPQTEDDPLIARIKECVLKTELAKEPLIPVSLAEETLNLKVDNSKDMTESSTTDSLKENLQENPPTVAKKPRRKRKLKLSQKKRASVKPTIVAEEEVSTISEPVESVAPVAELTSQSRSSSEPNLNEMPSKVDKPLTAFNSQRTRRKSKSSKRLDKPDVDMFKEFALVINKKTKRIPPISIVDEKLDERDKGIDLNDSVEEMDMELEDIPINTNIIERNDVSLSEVVLAKEEADAIIVEEVQEVEPKYAERSKNDSFNESLDEIDGSSQRSMPKDEIDGSSSPVAQERDEIDCKLSQEEVDAPLVVEDSVTVPQPSEDANNLLNETVQICDKPEVADQVVNSECDKESEFKEENETSQMCDKPEDQVMNSECEKKSEFKDENQLLANDNNEMPSGVPIVENIIINEEPGPETDVIEESAIEDDKTPKAAEIKSKKGAKKGQKKLKRKFARKKLPANDDKSEPLDCDSKSIPALPEPTNDEIEANILTTPTDETPTDESLESVNTLPETEPISENAADNNQQLPKKRGRKKSKATLPEEVYTELEATRVTRGQNNIDLSPKVENIIKPRPRGRPRKNRLSDAIQSDSEPSLISLELSSDDKLKAPDENKAGNDSGGLIETPNELIVVEPEPAELELVAAKNKRNRKVISYNEDDLEKKALEEAAKLKEITKIKNKDKKLKRDAEEDQPAQELLEKNNLGLADIIIKPKVVEVEPIGFDKGCYPVIAEAVVDILHADQIEALKEVNNVSKYGDLLRPDSKLLEEKVESKESSEDTINSEPNVSTTSSPLVLPNEVASSDNSSEKLVDPTFLEESADDSVLNKITSQLPNKLLEEFKPLENLVETAIRRSRRSTLPKVEADALNKSGNIELDSPEESTIILHKDGMEPSLFAFSGTAKKLASPNGKGRFKKSKKAKANASAAKEIELFNPVTGEVSAVPLDDNTENSIHAVAHEVDEVNSAEPLNNLTERPNRRSGKNKTEDVFVCKLIEPQPVNESVEKIVSKDQLECLDAATDQSSKTFNNIFEAKNSLDESDLGCDEKVLNKIIPLEEEALSDKTAAEKLPSTYEMPISPDITNTTKEDIHEETAFESIETIAQQKLPSTYETPIQPDITTTIKEDIEEERAFESIETIAQQKLPSTYETPIQPDITTTIKEDIQGETAFESAETIADQELPSTYETPIQPDITKTTNEDTALESIETVALEQQHSAVAKPSKKPKKIKNNETSANFEEDIGIALVDKVALQPLDVTDRKQICDDSNVEETNVSCQTSKKEIQKPMKRGRKKSKKTKNNIPVPVKEDDALFLETTETELQSKKDSASVNNNDNVTEKDADVLKENLNASEITDNFTKVLCKNNMVQNQEEILSPLDSQTVIEVLNKSELVITSEVLPHEISDDSDNLPVKQFGRKSKKCRNSQTPQIAKDEIQSPLLEPKDLDESAVELNKATPCNNTFQKETILPNTTEKDEMLPLESLMKKAKKANKLFNNSLSDIDPIPGSEETPGVMRNNRRSRKAINYNEDMFFGKALIQRAPKDVFEFDESSSDEDKGYKSMLIETDAEQLCDNLKSKFKKRGRKKAESFELLDNNQQMENMFDFGDELDVSISDKEPVVIEDALNNDKAKYKKQHATNAVKTKTKNKKKAKLQETEEEEDIFSFKDEDLDLNKADMEYQLDITEGSKIKIKKCFINSKIKNGEDKVEPRHIKDVENLQVSPEVIKDVFEFEDSFSDKDSNKTVIQSKARKHKKGGKRKQPNPVITEQLPEEPGQDNHKRIKKNFTDIDVSNILESDSSSRRSSKKIESDAPVEALELSKPLEEVAASPDDLDEIRSKASDSFSNVASPLCSPPYNSDDSLPLLDRADDLKPKNNDVLFDQLLQLGPTLDNKSVDVIEKNALEKSNFEGRLANINIKELLLSSVAPPESIYAEAELDEKKILPEDVTISALKEMFSEIKPLSEIINSSEMDIAPVLDEIDKSLESEDIYDFNEDVRSPPVSKRRGKNVKSKKKQDKSVEVPDKSLEAEKESVNGKINAVKESEMEANLRRSRRGNRKVASYNENDLIDPLIDALEKCRSKAKKVEEKPIPKPNLNSEELFELLKKTNDVQTTTPLEPVRSEIQDDGECSSNGAFDNIPDDDFDEMPDKVYEFTENSPENTDLCAKPKPVVAEPNYCDICKKSFIRLENLIKHRTTLTHISKLSELEAKEAEERSRAAKLKEDFEDTPLPNHSLKLVDIISDVLNKPVLSNFEKQQQDFLTPVETNNIRYKSLGERKSFESEHLLQAPVPYQNSILENQINLLENIIENNLENIAGNNRLKPDSDEISYCSSSSDKSALHINTEPDFIKPGQYEEISEDSTSARIYDESKQRKTLNRDEELFLECCSLLKSGSEVSNSVKTAAECNILKNRTMIPAPEEAQEYTDHSRTPTPLGDTYDDEASNSNTISSNWHLSSERSLDKNRSFSFGELKEKEAPGISFGEVLTQGLKNQFESSAKIVDRIEEEDLAPEEPPLSPISDKPDDSDCSTTSKKMVTKGARKVYEGLKVSIPTEDLNLDVLNTSPQNRKPDSTKTSPDSPRAKSRKSKPVKKSQVGSNLLFKVTKKKSPIVPAVVDDVFIKPSPIVEKPKPESDNDSYSDSIGADAKSVSSFSSISTTVPLKKPDNTPENITKNKYKIMGKIFKHAARSKQEEIEEELRNIPEIPEIDNLEMVENYVRSCQEANKSLLLAPAAEPEEVSKKPKMTEEEMNMLFDQLLGKDIQEVEAKPKPVEPKRKPLKPKGRKRARTTSDASDDDFNITKTTKKRTNKKNNQEDSGINMELELKECIGVASRKSQRSCTSGKQNVLVEYWSSDEEAFEAMLESQVTAKKERKKPPPVEEPMKRPTAPPKPSKPKKKPAKKQAISAEQAATNRRKRAAANPLYHWSSSSEDESQSLIEVRPIREEDDDDDRPIQHGWIVGDSPKKLVTMLALTKGKKTDFDGVKEQGKRRTSNAAS